MSRGAYETMRYGLSDEAVKLPLTQQIEVGIQQSLDNISKAKLKHAANYTEMLGYIAEQKAFIRGLQGELKQVVDNQLSIKEEMQINGDI